MRFSRRILLLWLELLGMVVVWMLRRFGRRMLLTLLLVLLRMVVVWLLRRFSRGIVLLALLVVMRMVVWLLEMVMITVVVWIRWRLSMVGGVCWSWGCGWS